MDFEKAKAAAIKILGKDAKFPKLPGNLSKDQAALTKAGSEAAAVRDEFEKKILSVKQALDQVINTEEAYIDVFDGTDFDLDPKDAKQKKQIDEATKVLTAPLDDDLKQLEKAKAVMEQIFKQIAAIARALDAG
jgi:hypothetical protein